ncbi:hypothetical protein ACTQ56_08610, partial [[Clostridium] aminophilum]|uniref:hypothetical protein n=1 Tax=[Clostridium] aminophilum TaxID=1526 RepID=UPI003F9A64FD
FRFHLAMDTLAFGYILPTTGRIRDFHPLETCAAGRTVKRQRFRLIQPETLSFISIGLVYHALLLNGNITLSEVSSGTV